jgi:TonB family protein
LIAEPPQDNVLRLELFGLISDRQMAELEAVAPVEAMEPETLLESEPEIIPEPEPMPIEPEPVVIQKPKPSPRPRPVEAMEGQEARQRASLNPEKESNAVKIYLASAVKAISSRLSYPRDARQKGLTGRPKVGFRVNQNGLIAAGSIVLRASSGHEVLDQKALAAVSQANLPSPPLSLVGKEITISLSFSREKNRS